MTHSDAQSVTQRLGAAIAALNRPRNTKQQKIAILAELQAVHLRLTCEKSQRRKRRETL